MHVCSASWTARGRARCAGSRAAGCGRGGTAGIGWRVELELGDQRVQQMQHRDHVAYSALDPLHHLRTFIMEILHLLSPDQQIIVSIF